MIIQMKNKAIILDRLKGLKDIPFYKNGSSLDKDISYITEFSKEQLEININEIIRLIEEE